MGRCVEEALPTDRRELLVAHVREAVALVLRADAAEQLGREERLLDLGLDSLMAVELRDRLTNSLSLGRKLPATLVFDQPSIAAIAAYIDLAYFAPSAHDTDVSAHRLTNGEAQPRQKTGLTVTASQLAHLSDEDVAKLLTDKLDAHG